MPDPAPGRLPTIARRCLVAAAGLLTLWVAWHWTQRLFHPFELEWMEGAMVDHAARVRAGLDLYVPPSPEHVQFLYTPLYFYLGALLAAVLGDGFLPLRLVSLFATLLCAFLVHDWVRRESGDRAAGLVAAGLFVGGYGYLHSWYDLARNDMLSLAGVLGTAMLLRFGGVRQALLAAVVATLAFLAKQSVLMWLPGLAVGALLLDRRRGCWFAAATAVLIVGTVQAYDLATDGWFSFFVFEMPRGHAIQPDRKLGFFTDDLVPLLPMIVLALTACIRRWRAGRRGEALFLAAFAGGGLLTSYLSRLHAGGYDNVLLYAFTAGCVLMPLAAVGSGQQRARTWPLALLLLQFALLVVDPRSLWLPRPGLHLDGQRFLPTREQRLANDELVAFLAAQPGPVFVPFHGHLAALAGKPRTAHAQAMADVVQLLGGHPPAVLLQPAASELYAPRALQALRLLFGGFHDALAQRRFAAVVLDVPNGVIVEQAFAAGFTNYERAPGSPIRNPPALQPPVGMVTHSPYVLVPRR